MARRSRDWNEGLAQDLQDPSFAREFLVGAVEEGIPLQKALGKVIRAMGVKEFADKVGMASPNVLRAINPRHNPTQETLNRLLRPFKLKLSLALLGKGEGKNAEVKHVCSKCGDDAMFCSAVKPGSGGMKDMPMEKK